MKAEKTKILGLIIGLVKIVALAQLFSLFSDDILLAIIASCTVIIVLNSEYRS